MRVVLASHGRLELAHSTAERATDLGQPLRAEHEQQDYDEKGDVQGIIETHVLSLSLDDRLSVMVERPAYELSGDDQQQRGEGVAQDRAGQLVRDRDAAGCSGE